MCWDWEAPATLAALAGVAKLHPHYPPRRDCIRLGSRSPGAPPKWERIWDIQSFLTRFGKTHTLNMGTPRSRCDGSGSCLETGLGKWSVEVKCATSVMTVPWRPSLRRERTIPFRLVLVSTYTHCRNMITICDGTVQLSTESSNAAMHGHCRRASDWTGTSFILTAAQLIDHPLSTPRLTSSPHHACTSTVCFPGYRKSLKYFLFPMETWRLDGTLVPGKVQWLADPYPRYQDMLARATAGA